MLYLSFFLLYNAFLDIMHLTLFHLGECHVFLVSGHLWEKGFYQGVSVKVHHTIPTHTFHLPSLIPLGLPIF